MTDRSVILVVEDHRETRTFLDLALSDKYRVETAESAAHALEKTAQTEYDILLVDIALRDTMDGMELVQRLREDQRYSDTPMIAMTAHQLHEEREHYLGGGFDAFLAKPFYPQDLLALIERLLSEGRQEPSSPPGDRAQ